MGFFDELKSGKFSIYGTYVALISVILLIALSGTMLSINPLSWIFSISGWFEAVLILLIEFPFCAKIFRGTDRILEISSNKMFKAITYAFMAGIIWLSAIITPTSILVAAAFLTLSSILYGIGVLRGEEGGSFITNPETHAQAAGGFAARAAAGGSR